MTRTFEYTRQALIRFDKTAPRRQKLWDKASNDKGVDLAEKADAHALALLREAYYKDTSDINQRDHRADIQFMRRMANGIDPAAPKAPNRVKMAWDKPGENR